MVAMQAIIDSGHGASMPSLSHKMSRPFMAKSWLCCMMAGQPPSIISAMYSMVAGIEHQAEMSLVPVQSNSCRKRVVSPSGKVMPWLMVKGWIFSWWSFLTCKNAEPLGAQSHLWQLLVVYDAPIFSR